MENILSLSLWESVYGGNTISEYAKAVGLFVVYLVVFGVVQRVILLRLKRLAKRTQTEIDDIAISVVRSIRPSLYSFLAFFFSVQSLVLGEVVSRVITIVLIVFVAAQVIFTLRIIIDFIAKRAARRDKGSAAAIGLLGSIAKGVVWVLGILLILSNIGVDITSLVAGLGIGGVAVAFALQGILSDLFASFAIYFDKPFVPGDFIVAGDHAGTVKKIGIKTTRIQSLQGEEIIVSNQELTSARIQNYKRMKERRVAFSVGVTYETPTEKLKEIPKIAEGVISKIAAVRFGRAHWNRFDDSALSYEIVYHIETADYARYMDVQQEINLGIKEAFDRRGIEFAYPTRTVYTK